MHDNFFIKDVVHYIAIIGYKINCVDRTDERDFAPQSSSPVLVPTQGDSSVNDYCRTFHMYLVASGKVEDKAPHEPSQLTSWLELFRLSRAEPRLNWLDGS
jgi:hypothetical protein